MKIEIDTELNSKQEIQDAIELLRTALSKKGIVKNFQSRTKNGYVNIITPDKEQNTSSEEKKEQEVFTNMFAPNEPQNEPEQPANPLGALFADNNPTSPPEQKPSKTRSDSKVQFY